MSGLFRHGTWDGYCNHGCRCSACVEEGSAYRRLLRAVRPALPRRSPTSRSRPEYPAFDGTQHCHGLDLREFYSEDGTKGSQPRANGIMACVGCPFLEPCREWGLAFEEWGVWGGTTGEERERLRRERGLPAPPMFPAGAAWRVAG